MKKEKVDMKILKWEDKNGFFLNKENKYEDITKINSEEIINLMELIIEKECNLDEINSEDNNDDNLKNSPKFIIYEKIYNNFLEILNNKEAINNEIDGQITEFTNSLEKL